MLRSARAYPIPRPHPVPARPFPTFFVASRHRTPVECRRAGDVSIRGRCLPAPIGPSIPAGKIPAEGTQGQAMVSLRAQIAGDENDSVPANDVHHIDCAPEHAPVLDAAPPRSGTGKL